MSEGFVTAEDVVAEGYDPKKSAELVAFVGEYATSVLKGETHSQFMTGWRTCAVLLLVLGGLLLIRG